MSRPLRDDPKEDVGIRDSVTIWSFSESGDGYSTDVMTDRTGPEESRWRVGREVCNGLHGLDGTMQLMHAMDAQKLSAQPRWYCRRAPRQENESWSADGEDLALHVATYAHNTGWEVP